MENVQELIESSKFELGAFKLSEIQKLTGNAQIIFILLLSLARQRHEDTDPNVVRAAVELDDAMATALLALSTRIASDSEPEVKYLEGTMKAFERAVAAGTKAPGETSTDPQLTERQALYRALVAAINRLSSEPLHAEQNGHEVRVLAIQ